MKHPVLTVALAAVVVVMLSSSVSATETVADRERNTTESAAAVRSRPRRQPMRARPTTIFKPRANRMKRRSAK